jgi:tetrahydromethanopterin S-methyltransferase subunit B
MDAKTKALSEEARKLSPEERIELIEDLQRSLDPTPTLRSSAPGRRKPATASTPIVAES